VFGIPVTLIVYGIMALGAVAVFGGFVLLERTAGADVQKAADAPVMLLCQTPLNAHGVKDCAAKMQQSIADVATLTTNNKTLTDSIAAANAKVQTFADAAKQAKAAADLANKQADEDAAFFTQRLLTLKANLQHPSENPNADADRILRDYARDSVHK
jgi:hypothetical protein